MKTFIRLALTGFIVAATVLTVPTVANAVDGDPWTGLDQNAPHRPIVPSDDVRAPRQVTFTENVFTDLSLSAPLRKDALDGSDGTLAGE